MKIPKLLEGNCSAMPPALVVRATLYHLNGSSSQVIIAMPHYTDMGECYETAAMHLNDYVFYLASRWVKISSFKVEVGEFASDGVFVPGYAVYPLKEIPLGKVYQQGERGKWIKLPD